MKKNKVVIIAEAGINYNGSFKNAKKLIDVAAKAGAHYIKFQTYNLDDMVIKKSPLADYQKQRTSIDTQYEMLKKYNIKKSVYPKLIEHCKKKKINFLSSPFDVNSINFLKKLKVKIFKIPSGEITNYPYLKVLAKLSSKIILSTGMSTIKEIKKALEILIKFGTKKNNITILHCVSDYPTKYKNVNLKNILSLKNKFKIKIGFSDHTNDNLSSILAVALGAEIIEKHITLSNKARGPDHIASLNPKNFLQFVRDIKNAQIILGSEERRVTTSEKKNLKVARKSIYATKNITKGEIFTNNNITTKRPGNNLSAIYWNKVINKSSKYNFKIDQPIRVLKKR